MSKRYPGGIIRKTPQTPSQTSAQGVWDMASVTQAVKENTWPIAGVPDPISKSLRFRSSASAYLNRTFGTPTNNKIWTFSAWIKRGALSTNQHIFDAAVPAGQEDYIRFITSNIIQFSIAAQVTSLINTTQVFRDPSAWYHLVLACDTTQATASNRVKIYINGTQITAFGTANYPAQNSATYFNSAASHSIGSYGGGGGSRGNYFDGLITETYFIDGQQLTPSSFGSTNDQTGVWQPIAYTGTYGTNGFYLPFSNTASTATLGNDFSGNSNNWTTNNISLTSGSTYDSMVDVPTQWIPYNTAGDTGALFRGNYATLNPVLGPSASGWYAPTITNGNLNYSTSLSSNAAGGNCNLSTININSGKWYAEFTIGTRSGIPVAANDDFGVVVGIYPGSSNYSPSIGVVYKATNGQIRVDGAGGTAYGSSYTTGDVIGVALDMDSGKVWFSKNGTWQNSGDPAAGTNPAASSRTGTYGIGLQVNTFANAGAYTTAASANYGQQPFSYTPPTGFETLCTTNLSTPTIGATASTIANKYFDATLYTGTGSSQTISSLNFSPDFVWIKERSADRNHRLQDAVRGANKSLRSNGTQAEATDSADGYVSAFTSNGFTTAAGSSSILDVGESSGTYVAWCWDANGSGSTNTAGSITSTVSANTTAGFSIVTYTGTGANATVGHGLGVTPAMYIVKIRSGANNWTVWHQNLANTTTSYILLDSTAAQTTSANVWGSTAATSSTIGVGTAGVTNANGSTYVAYCFAQVAGYSAFGSYTGNGSSDGPFVFCGFRPRFVMIKRTDNVGDWYMLDTARDTYNLVTQKLMADLSAAENGNGESTSTNTLDIISNGFKMRSTNTATNTSSGTYIYMAFAESPFKFALAR